ncbi:MAG: hypothetical protein R3336_06310 [Phycisphaeraceae bacterium]|nr:hypothetical protein [Phycisphaeraceae bacterium]
MDVKNFLAQHRLRTNPFDAEEARHDRVFSEMLTDPTAHPDFAKVLGQIDQPSSAVVFGEKGAGKTAMRLMVGKAVNEHNLTHPEKRTLLVAYDDLNPVLDRIATRHHGGADRPAEALEKVRLEDHQDAILSLAVTQLVNSIVGTSDPGAESMQLPEDTQKRLRRMPRRLRIDLAVLAALYDQPHSGTTVNRFHELRSTLRINWGVIPPALLRWLAILLTLIVGGFIGARYGNQTVVQSEQITEWINSPWPTAMAAVAAAGGLLAWGLWGWRQI